MPRHMGWFFFYTTKRHLVVWRPCHFPDWLLWVCSGLSLESWWEGSRISFYFPSLVLEVVDSPSPLWNNTQRDDCWADVLKSPPGLVGSQNTTHCLPSSTFQRGHAKVNYWWKFHIESKRDMEPNKTRVATCLVLGRKVVWWKLTEN